MEKSIFTLRNVLRVLLLLCIVFVFCPAFLVSCADEDMEVSVMTAVKGIKVYGEYAVDPNPIMLICLIIPVVALVLLFVKTVIDNSTILIILGSTIIDTIIWFVFRSAVRERADENYCTFETTGWFVINIICLLLIIGINLLIISGIANIDRDLITLFSGEKTQDSLKQISETVGNVSNAVNQIAGNIANNIANNMGPAINKENIMGYCCMCGSPIEFDSKFCIKCGNPVPEDMIAKAEEARRRELEEKARLEEEARRRELEEKARLEEEARRRELEEKARLEEEARRRELEEKEDEEKTHLIVNNQSVDSMKTQIYSKVRYCHMCGTELEQDALFCPKCGVKVV